MLKTAVMFILLPVLCWYCFTERDKKCFIKNILGVPTIFWYLHAVRVCCAATTSMENENESKVPQVCCAWPYSPSFSKKQVRTLFLIPLANIFLFVVVCWICFSGNKADHMVIDSFCTSTEDCFFCIFTTELWKYWSAYIGTAGSSSSNCKKIGKKSENTF